MFSFAAKEHVAVHVPILAPFPCLQVPDAVVSATSPRSDTVSAVSLRCPIEATMWSGTRAPSQLMGKGGREEKV
jgi:hypothetical protein